MSKRLERNRKTLDALTDALGSSEGQSVEEVKEELREDGIDIDGALRRLRAARRDASRGIERKPRRET